jgi:DNA-binding response OmpR family regulator
MLETMRYSAALLDLGLPDDDGLAVLRRIRQRENPLPIIILTARGATDERITGLDMGADDYLVKPFDFDELEARLRAVLRRQGAVQGATFTVGNMAFDSVARELTVEDVRVPLSAREADIAELMMRRVGRVVTKQLAEDQLFGLSDTLGSNAVEVYVHRLRKKIEAAGASARIETIRGVGYLLRDARDGRG